MSQEAVAAPHGIHLIAISKYRKVDLEDGEHLFNVVKAFEGMELKGHIQGREFKVDNWFGKMFNMKAEGLHHEDAHVILLGPFNTRERGILGKYFSDFIETGFTERYKNDAGEIIVFPGGAAILEKLTQHLAKQDALKKAGLQ